MSRQTYIFLLCLIVFAVGRQAAAQTATVTWVNPTTRSDGSPLLVTDISKYTVNVGNCPTSGGDLPLTPLVRTFNVINAASGSGPILLPSFGLYCFAVFLYDGNGKVSDAATKRAQIVAPPLPVVNVTVTTSALESFRNNTGAVYLGRNVGTIPLGVACIGSVRLARDGPDYYEIPLARVTLTKQPKPSAVLVSRCAAS